MKEEGDAHFEAKRYQAAIDVYSICLVVDPTFLPAYLNRAAPRLALKDYRGAISDCNTVLSTDNTQVEAWYR